MYIHVYTENTCQSVSSLHVAVELVYLLVWLLSIQLSRELAGSKWSLGPWNGGREGGGGIHIHVHVIIIICMYDGCQGGRERGGGVYIHVPGCKGSRDYA